MHLVVVHGWQKDEAEVAKIIAETCGILVFEARQKIAGGGPMVLTSFADPARADALTAKLSQAGVPALVVDSEAVRNREQPFPVSRLVLGPQSLQIESFSGESRDIDYGAIELLLVATGIAGQTQTTSTVSERKFSLGKTMLSGGVPMTKKVTTEVSVTEEERGEILWLYVRGDDPQGRTAMIFDRAALSYDGLGDAMQLTRDLNFNYLKTELQRLAPQASYDERMIKRAGLVRVLGPILSPEIDLDLAFEIMACGLRAER
jgi:hypothetical protein